MATFQRPEWTAASASRYDNNPGRFNDVIPVSASTTLECTGSAWGIGAVIVPTGATGTISGSSGTISAADLAGLGVVEFGPTKIAVTAGIIYALKRNNGAI